MFELKYKVSKNHALQLYDRSLGFIFGPSMDLAMIFDNQSQIDLVEPQSAYNWVKYMQP